MRQVTVGARMHVRCTEVVAQAVMHAGLGDTMTILAVTHAEVETRAGVELLTVPWEAVEQPSTRRVRPKTKGPCLPLFPVLPVCLGLRPSCGDACRAHAQNMRPHNRPVLAFSRDLLRAKARAWA